MLFSGGSKNIKIKAVFFILFLLWILMAQGKHRVDSLGLWRNAGWNWPPCRLQAIGFCTTFSGLIRYCKFNFHVLEADKGCRDNTAQLSPSGTDFPGNAYKTQSRGCWLWKSLQMPLAMGQGVRQRAVPWPLLSSVWEANMDKRRPGVCSAQEGILHIFRA